MYTKFKLSNVQLGDIKIGNVEVESKYKLDEVQGIYTLVKTAIKEIPEMLEDMKAGALKFREIEKEFEEFNEVEHEEKLQTAVDSFLTFEANVRQALENLKEKEEEDPLKGLKEE